MDQRNEASWHLLLTFSIPTQVTISMPLSVSYEVVVVGGGAAGIGAAIGARQALPDSRILVIESESCLGGATTHRGVVSYCGLFTCEDRPRKAIGGVLNELYRRLMDVGATTEKPTRYRGVFQVILTQILILVGRRTAESSRQNRLWSQKE